MTITKESTPPPVIGKAGRYTVFITPPATPKLPVSPASTPKPPLTPLVTPTPSEPSAELPKIPSSKVVLPPVQPPPQQFEKSRSNSSMFGLFWDAVAKVQNAHSCIDEYLADWFGLNQSKYQWALNDYYESTGMEQDVKTKEMVSKGQCV
ncbi:PREDICTED: anther-specific proline-rich protein APG [Nelumbo nucifera]|uniref:Anther-specific proline-rich protein APG n=1 Tax=Nelumbo nucifera TaxID=4432 RepID=A0A1U8ADL6_NELNU|nr:PREDICTED: anther-specific proline-rich protein APG [Nelumbo nucifera]